MRLDQAFRRAGFEIVSAVKAPDGKRLVFEVRVPAQGNVPGRFRAMIDEVLTMQEVFIGKGTDKWRVDISKKFFSKNRVTRWIWRIDMAGDIVACQLAVSQATLSSLRTGVELTEVPLVGHTDDRPDLKSGRVKGAYSRNDDDRASGVVASAMMGGGGVPYRPMSDGDLR